MALAGQLSWLECCPHMPRLQVLQEDRIREPKGCDLPDSWLLYELEFSHPALSPNVPISSFSQSPTISEAGNHCWLYPFPPFPHLDVHWALTSSSCQLHLFLPTANTLAYPLSTSLFHYTESYLPPPDSKSH